MLTLTLYLTDTHKILSCSTNRTLKSVYVFQFIFREEVDLSAHK